MVPADVLDLLRVGVLKAHSGVDAIGQLILLVHVPNANLAIIAAG